MGITQLPFGETHEDEDEVSLYTLHSPTMEVGVINYGASVVSIKCPDKNNKQDDVVTGFTGVRGYESYPKYFGSTVGRVCGRIVNGKFCLDGKTYNLPLNDCTNSHHGGKIGFDKKIWQAEILSDNAIAFHLDSKDGEEGYPGTLKVCTKYVLDGPELLINYTATTDKATIVNITHHSYFNLAGHDEWKEIYDHKLTIYADKMLPISKTLAPTGEIKDVEGTLFDLRTPAMLTQKRLDSVPGPGGYDHNFCLPVDGKRKLAARLEHEPSGRVMTVETTQPGIQLYTADQLEGVPGKHGDTYGKRSCLCLETQNWPDAINRVGTFPNVILRPGETYDQSTWLTFSIA